MDLTANINAINAEIEKKHPRTLSFSKCVDMIQEPFDSIASAQNCYNRGYDDPNSKYYHMTAEEIVSSWEKKNETAKVYGKKLDEYAELVLLGKDRELWLLDNNFDYDERLKNICTGFDQFIATLYGKTDYRYVAREIKVYTFGNGDDCINGRFDCLFYSPSADKYMLIDWKSNEEIKTVNNFQKLKGPCYRIPDCNGNIYSMQLGMYKMALCETYHIAAPEKIDTFICQCLGTPLANGNLYLLHKPYVAYDKLLLTEIIDFAYKKKKILDKK